MMIQNRIVPVLILLFFFSFSFGQKTDLAELIDQWHAAAASADEDVFFGLMSEDAVYIGTDISERWLRDELKEWSKEYFDRESAWSFTSYDKHVMMDEDGNYAYWDEKLNTWMGPCRGSGVLRKEKDGWKIIHYHLSVTVPNEKIKAFIQLVEGE